MSALTPEGFTVVRPPRVFLQGVAAAGLPGRSATADPVTEDDLAGLPPAVARYLGALALAGRPRSWSLPAHLIGRDGRPRMTGGAAVWHLPDEEYRYAEMTPQSLDLDVPPGG